MKRSLLFTIILLAATLTSCEKDASAPSSYNGGGVGQGGSLARFTISNGYLYVADKQNLHTYNISANGIPQFASTVYIGMDVETIYSYNNYLFIGSQNAMYIYSTANPATPVKEAEATHTRACDPVVVKDNIAYVTVRSGTSCGGNVNALMVYNVTNVKTPTLYQTINMESPMGLGYKGDRLYVCNGASGMTVYNIAVGTNPSKVKTVTGENMKDVIVKDNLLIVMLEKGFAIYTLGANDEIVQVGKMIS